MNAGSSLPPLATSTALTTLASKLGNASISVASASDVGFVGRGGCGGGLSSVFVFGGLLRFSVLVVFSTASSSNSNGCAVVGDSAVGDKFLCD